MITASGSGRESVISGVAAGLRVAGVPYCRVSRDGCECRLRGRHGDGSAIDAAGDAERGEAPVLLVSADRTPFLRGFDEAVVIICPNTPCSEAEVEGRVFVVTDGKTELPAGLRRFPLISCGMGGKETVTFSSIRPDGGMVCLQRQVNTFSGRIAEPQEYAFERVGSEAFPTLAAFTALLLCGCIE